MNLDDMSLDELKALRKQVDKAISGYEDRKKKEAIDQLEPRISRLGHSEGSHAVKDRGNVLGVHVPLVPDDGDVVERTRRAAASRAAWAAVHRLTLRPRRLLDGMLLALPLWRRLRHRRRRHER